MEGNSQLGELPERSHLVSKFEAFTNTYLDKRMSDTLGTQGIELDSETGRFCCFMIQVLHRVAQDVGHMIRARVLTRKEIISPSGTVGDCPVVEIALEREGAGRYDDDAVRLSLGKTLQTAATRTRDLATPAGLRFRQPKQTQERADFFPTYQCDQEFDIVKALAEKGKSELDLGVFGWLESEPLDPDVPASSLYTPDGEDAALLELWNLTDELDMRRPGQSLVDEPGLAHTLAAIQKLTAKLTAEFRQKRANAILQRSPLSLQGTRFFRELIEHAVVALDGVADRFGVQMRSRLMLGTLEPDEGIILKNEIRSLPRGGWAADFQNLDMILLPMDDIPLAESASTDDSAPVISESCSIVVLGLLQELGTDGIDLGSFGV